MVFEGLFLKKKIQKLHIFIAFSCKTLFRLLKLLKYIIEILSLRDTGGGVTDLLRRGNGLSSSAFVRDGNERNTRRLL